MSERFLINRDGRQGKAGKTDQNQRVLLNAN